MAIQQLPVSTSNALAADARTLSALKLQAGSNDPAAVKEAAKQFESLFMRELMKSMRQATMKSGMNDSAGENLGTDLLDQQFAVQMSGMPGGLSDLIAKQLSQQQAARPDAADAVRSTVSLQRAALPTGSASGDFVQQHNDVAQKVGQESGIPASFMLGQAGHETGWGKHQIRNKDGSASYNLFGIKAGAGWTGKTASVTTTEYVDGQPHKTVAKFRAYDSYEESFRDYAKLINENPRYAGARQQTASAQAYATELKRAGYATDPAYASKLSRAISSAAQWQRST